MKTPIITKQFERDQKRCLKRGYDMAKFKACATNLLSDAPLPSNAKPHPLIGNYTGYFDCHIANDWVLIYKITPTAIIFQRMGSHADLFE